MAVDKLVDSTQLDSDLTSVANAIRAKSGGSSQLAFPAGFVNEIGNIPSGGQPAWELIDTFETTLTEYTGTTADQVDTDISIEDLGDYAFLLFVISCDSAVESSMEWGMSVILSGRYNTNGRLNVVGEAQQIGFSSLSLAAMASSTSNSSIYGVYMVGNKATIYFIRKCDSSHVTKIRAGKYTLKVYGLASL